MHEEMYRSGIGFSEAFKTSRSFAILLCVHDSRYEMHAYFFLYHRLEHLSCVLAIV